MTPMSGNVYIGPTLMHSLAAMFTLLAVPGLPESAIEDPFELSEDAE